MVSASEHEVLERIYHDASHSASYSGPQDLLKAARSAGLAHLRLDEVSRWLEQNTRHALHAPAPNKIWKRPRIKALGPLHLWQGDSAIFGAKNDTAIRGMWPGWPAALCVVDAFSGWTAYRPLKDKKSETSAEAFRSILREDWPGQHPIFFSSDRGTEYTGNAFQAMLMENAIAFYPAPQPTVKAALAENKIRYLKGTLHLIADEIRSSADRRWPLQRPHFPTLLRQIGSAYNHTEQPTRLGPGMTPAAVSFENAAQVALHRYPHLAPQDVKTILPVGTVVRMSTSAGRGLFRKGYGVNWSIELFRVKRIIPRNPVMYKLSVVEENGTDEELEGSYFREELQRVAL